MSSARCRTPALIALSVLATSTALLPNTGAAAAAAPAYTLRHIAIDTLVGPNGDVPCTVDADLYLPAEASTRHKVPAVLTTNGFGGSKDDSGEASIGSRFAKAGYAVLAYSGLGFGKSDCKIYLDDPDYDGLAGKQLVDVLAGTRDFTDTDSGATDRVTVVAQEKKGDPRVGMIGGSYGGQIQYAIAEQDPRIDALIPIITWNDLSYSLAPNNTSQTTGVTYATPGVHKRGWTSLFFGLGVADGVQETQVDPTRNVGCPNFNDAVCVAKAQLDSLGYPLQSTLDLARHASVASYMSRIKVPVLLSQGQTDSLFNIQEATSTFESLKAQGTPVSMIWKLGGHSGPEAAGEFDGDTLAASYLGRRYLAWFDRYVAGKAAVDPGPEFSYFRDWVSYDTAAGKAGTAVEAAYVEKKHFNPDTNAALYFSGTDALTPVRTAVMAGSSMYGNANEAPTSYSETSALEGSAVNNPVSDAPGTFAAYTSPVLTRAATLVGSGTVTVTLDAPVAGGSQAADPGGMLVVFAKVYDVAPDGSVTLQHRLISPARINDVGGPVEIGLPGVVHRFDAGHRIQVVLAASDAAYNGNHLAQPVTVLTSPESPSVLRLPIRGGGLRF